MDFISETFFSELGQIFDREPIGNLLPILRQLFKVRSHIYIQLNTINV